MSDTETARSSDRKLTKGIYSILIKGYNSHALSFSHACFDAHKDCFKFS